METPLIYQSMDTLSGIPVFYGTRVPVHNLIDYLATGETIETFLEDFPSVSREQVIRFLETAETTLVAGYHSTG
jgi:uncharacterized protein (DUF433 family)